MTPPPSRQVAQSPARDLRVLVVDDDPRVRAGLADVLVATPGLTVAASTGSARRALAVASARSADVALVDALLPTLADGVRLVRALAVHLPVVAISLDGASRAEMLAAGAVAFVEKDAAVDDLLFTLTAAPRAAQDGDGHIPRDRSPASGRTRTRPPSSPTRAAPASTSWRDAQGEPNPPGPRGQNPRPPVARATDRTPADRPGSGRGSERDT